MSYNPGYGTTAGAGGGSWAGGLAQWAKDNPQLAAAIVAAAGTYAQSATAKTGKLDFKQQPETPEERALRIHAMRLAGVPDPTGAVLPGAMPTYKYLGPQIGNMLENINANSQAYQPLERLDVNTGQPVARAPVTTKPFDFSTVQKPWETVGQPTGAAATAANPNSAAYAPPPPPPQGGAQPHEKRKGIGKMLGGAVGGALGGIVGGPVGAFAGAAGGILQAGKKWKSEKEAAWAKSWEPYNTWVSLYGNSFTDAAGHPVKAPTNSKEYNAWYVSKYGVPPPTGGS
jgi:hypothetical protein